METYTLFREIADSWVLLAMFAFFLGAGVWAFWPSQKSKRIDASLIPFRDEASDCDRDCDRCSCRFVLSEEPFDVR